MGLRTIQYMITKEVILIYPKTGMDTPDTISLPLALLLISGKLAADERFTITILDQRLNKNWRKQLKDKLASSNSICVGLSAMTGTQIRHALEAASLVRKFNPRIPLIWGGIHPTLAPFETIADPLVDIVVIGEAEDTFSELVLALNDGTNLCDIPGILYKDNSGNIVETPDRMYANVSDPPEIPYHLLDVTKYFYDVVGTKALPMLFSRGCPHRCEFCYLSNSEPPKWRPFPLEYVLKEIANLQAFGAKTIIPLDDNYFVDRKRVIEICELLKVNNVHVNFHVNCRIDYADKMDEEFLQALIDNGFISWDFGIESGSQKILDYMKKDIKVDQILRVNMKLKKVGIVPTYSFMGGFYGETYEDLMKTVNLMLTLLEDNPEAFISPIKIYTPFPDTTMIKSLPESYWVPPKTLRDWADYDYNTPQITWHNRRMTRRLQKVSYFTYFFDTKRLISVFGKNILVRKILGIYSLIARYRVKNGFYGFSLDFYLLKLLYFLRK